MGCRLRVLPVALLGLASAAHAGACKVTSFGTIPVEMQGSQPTTLIKVNGRETRFLVDTGAFFGTMSRATAVELGLKIGPAPYGLRGVGVGGSYELQAVKVAQLGLLGATIANIEFTVGGTDIGMPVLGANVLGAVDLELDLAKGEMRLMKAVDCAKTGMAYWTKGGSFETAALTSDGRKKGRSPALKVLINGKPVVAVLDTGASGTVLTKQAAERAGIDLTAPGVEPAGFSMGFGRAQVRSWTVPVDTVSIGTETIQRPRLRVLDSDLGGTTDMLLGIDFILAHRIFVASSQGLMYFTYNGGPVFASGIAKKYAATAAVAAALPAAQLHPAPPEETLKSAADHVLRGNARLSRGDVVAGLADLQLAARLEPGVASHQLALARGLATAQRPVEALASYDRALTLDPGNLDALLQRARLRLVTHDRDGALGDARAAGQRVTPGASSGLAVAQLYVVLDEPLSALPLYDAWIKLHGADAQLGPVLNQRCWARALANSDLAGALDDCQRAIKLNGRIPAYLDSLGMVQLRLKAYRDAIAAYEQALAKAPGQAWSRYGLGLARMRSGQNEAGTADLAAAKAIDPDIARQFERFGI